MKTSSFEMLEKSALPPEQAQAILQVLESEMTASQQSLATRADLLALRSDFLTLRSEFRELRTEVRGEIQALRAEMAGMGTKAELYAVEGRLSRMLLNCFLGGVGLLAGAVYFLYAHPGR